MLSLPYASGTLREKFSGFSPGPAVQTALVLVALMLSLEYWGLLVKIRPPDFGLYNIAVAMSTIKDRDYVVATTEAGIVPYFSGWRAVDLYGLNDAEIVHNPRGLTEAYLEQRNPAVIFNHYPDQDYLAGNPKLRQTVQVTEDFATSHGYQLAAVWGYNICDRDIWYVRKDIPEAQQLIAAIQRFPYVISGVTMVDLRGVPVPKDCWQPPIHLGLSQ